VVSQLKVNEIIKQSGSTLTIGQDGDTVSGPFTNVPAFEAYLASDQTVSDNVTTKAQPNTEVFDTDNCYDNSTNYRFTPTVAGKYFVYGSIYGDSGASSNLQAVKSFIYKNGSVYKNQQTAWTNNLGRQASIFLSAIIDMNGSTDYVELYGAVNTNSGNGEFYGDSTADKATYFGAYRIIGA